MRDFTGQDANEALEFIGQDKNERVIFIGQCATKRKCRGGESYQQPLSLRHLCNENPGYDIYYHTEYGKTGNRRRRRCATKWPGARAVLGHLRKYYPLLPRRR